MVVLKPVCDFLSSIPPPPPKGCYTKTSYHVVVLPLNIVVEEKLNELLDADGGISKRKVSKFLLMYY